MSAISYEVLNGFLAEARGYIEAVRETLPSVKGATDREPLIEIHRRVHTLRGAASMLELEEVTHLATSAEKMLEPLLESEDELSAKMQKELAALIDQPLLESEDELSAKMQKELAALIDQIDVHLVELATQEDTLAGEQFEIPDELMEIFSLEAQEHNQVIQTQLEQSLRNNPQDTDALGEVRRATHTLKGAAASVGIQNIAAVAHLMEELLQRHIEEDVVPDNEVIDLLLDSADALESLAESRLDKEAIALIESVDERYANLLGEDYTPLASPDSDAPSNGSDDQPAARPSRRSAENILRLPLSTVDALINRVGEIIINRSSVEGHLGVLKNLASELDYSTRRLRQVAIDIDDQIESTIPSTMGEVDDESTFDPIEMDRYNLLHQYTLELEEVTSDTGNINNDLKFLTDELDGSVTRERRLTTELQDGLMATRLVSFREIETRLRRTVRRAARDLGKQVELTLTGFDTEVDKTILDTLADPLMHMIRNSIDHGIEKPGQRRGAGKSLTGNIRLEVTRERGRVIIIMQDDGAGVDTDNVRQRAIQAGIVGDNELLSDEQLLDVLFREGFSTAAEVTYTSGRGVGLDIVQRAVSQLQGTVRLTTEIGQGTTFTISVPVTLAITRALFFESADQAFAVPLEQISSILRLQEGALDEIREQDMLRHEDQVYSVYNLDEFIRGPQATLEEQGYGLVIDVGEQPTVVLVDRLAGTSEAVVKSLGTHLRRVYGISGATISGDGGVVLILDLVEVIGADQPQRTTYEAPPIPDASAFESLHVLVVDDSLSVRRVVSSFLERSGMQTTSAKDGIEALEMMSISRPDVALVDIEMPRMNGYELLSRIKSDPSLRNIPVVFLTSRSAQKHRERAAELNVDGYLVKPYREDALLEELTRVAQRQI